MGPRTTLTSDAHSQQTIVEGIDTKTGKMTQVRVSNDGRPAKSFEMDQPLESGWPDRRVAVREPIETVIPEVVEEPLRIGTGQGRKQVTSGPTPIPKQAPIPSRAKMLEEARDASVASESVKKDVFPSGEVGRSSKPESKSYSPETRIEGIERGNPGSKINHITMKEGVDLVKDGSNDAIAELEKHISEGKVDPEIVISGLKKIINKLRINAADRRGAHLDLEHVSRQISSKRKQP
jgi:hypothetical protein